MKRNFLKVAELIGLAPVPFNNWHYAADDQGIHKDISCGGDGTRFHTWNPLEKTEQAMELLLIIGGGLIVRGNKHQVFEHFPSLDICEEGGLPAIRRDIFDLALKKYEAKQTERTKA